MTIFKFFNPICAVVELIQQALTVGHIDCRIGDIEYVGKTNSLTQHSSCQKKIIMPSVLG